MISNCFRPGTPLSFVMTFLTDCSIATVDDFPLKTDNSSRGDISHLLSALREHSVITSDSAKSVKEKNCQRDSSHGEKFDYDDELEAEQIEEKKKKEYAQLKAAAKLGLVDENSLMYEQLIAFKRAGANLIASYFAKKVAQQLRS